ncbi:hypothetical protein GCM10009839_25870 [Catenulispora yoronensis]|uniref:Uncharacterized protein n=1 Tax=Catenulispora yoronensis TaxID=450799 RepID=A0ABP5FJK6_9ACTN
MPFLRAVPSLGNGTVEEVTAPVQGRYPIHRVPASALSRAAVSRVTLPVLSFFLLAPFSSAWCLSQVARVLFRSAERGATFGPWSRQAERRPSKTFDAFSAIRVKL